MSGAERRGGALRVVCAFVLAIAIAIAVAIFVVVRGATSVDQWVVRQVVLITNSYLVPDIDFQGAKFEYPGTLRLREVTLTAPTGEKIIEAGSLVITLAETPRRGQPIRIESVEFRDTVLRILEDAQTGEIKGLVPFVRKQAIRSPDSVPEDVRLSNVLQIKRIELRNGSIEYNDGSGRPPMLLDQIELLLDVDRQQAASSGPLMHRLDFSLDRPPIFSLDVLGAASLDNFDLRLDRLDLSMKMGEDSYGALPPALQAFVRAHEAQGQLRVLMTGEGALTDLAKARAEATLKLDQFSVASGDTRFSIDQATMEVHTEDGVAAIGPCRVDLLNGVFNLAANAQLIQPGVPAVATWNLTGAQLAELMRKQSAGDKTPSLSGVIVSQGELSVNLAEMPESVNGKGTLAITEARLIKIPVVAQLANVVNAFGVLGGDVRSSSVDSSFQLNGQGILFDKLLFTNAVAAADATGLVGYDGSLDLTASAGPLKKITGMLGQVGNIVGAITGQVIKYRVRGTIEKPTISTRPLGIGA